MVTKRIKKIGFFSYPITCISMVLDVFYPKNIESDLHNCIALIGTYGEIIPDAFICALIVAEDHRNDIHPGIDFFAIIRAIWVKLRTGAVHGGSTIEQQFVRVATNRYERTLFRKLREQAIALILVRRVEKRKIASAYLSIAFYGTNFIGIDGLKSYFGEDLSRVTVEQALKFVSQLKYPRPEIPDLYWFYKLERRIKKLKNRS
ncbi:biosynthetic peptidoglycan transglycosylase [Silvimonas iriomotensis]|uniref:Glycosyl transferase family 51 domain-containing protein n=1 Tax=Silvimonas iriomotensis TaxID=449662 RepID=A0ABQ2P457_9NEIS|nr:biosynthetic peptidoglycan transglycosylase [Silvimonas iriomotensis]GGP17774.1 hypothetical protein GCM10010970_01480 [Silvimonas iriomotensis]